MPDGLEPTAEGALATSPETKVVKEIVQKDVLRLGKFKLEDRNYSPAEVISYGERHADNRVSNFRPELEQEFTTKFSSQLEALKAENATLKTENERKSGIVNKSFEAQLTGLPELLVGVLKAHSEDPEKQFEYLNTPDVQKMVEALKSQSGGEFGKAMNAPGGTLSPMDQFVADAEKLTGRERSSFMNSSANMELQDGLLKTNPKKFHSLMSGE